MVDIGIVVISYNIPDNTKIKFIMNINMAMSHSNLSYEICIIDNNYNILTNEIFNKPKALNIGIKKLLNTSKVILVTDIDIISEIGLIDKQNQTPIPLG